MLAERNISSGPASQLIKIQGAVIQVQVHVGDLQEILGLPAYSFRPPFRDPVDFETTAPAKNMDDVDHLNDHL
ncbi:hypothetical protein PPTG_09129 [Phytophthora nicotianae INRA-310]|uniref:Uncharacterized protein n=1 Tax=Phytophthora nicotianae (strain INRA-310) TaxID=761204 RepID=W2QGF8_PHYN3|nr:hypothetical protein PPTG_09129 [Phytophthora nicotianae INRA-310]ETN12257.1 hypothetical protein PPTG_09129 [Phytophthora nicotianae INRA-310]